MQEIKGKVLTIKLTHEVIAELDRIAKRLNYNRTETIRSLLDLGTDVFKKYETSGVVQLIEIKNRARKTLKEDVTPSLF